MSDVLGSADNYLFLHLTGGCSGCGEQDLLVHCFDCKADFCSKCNITIHQPVKFKAHRRGAVEARELINNRCPIHREKLKVYCFSPSCCTPICVLCTTIGAHKTHDFRPIQDVFVAEKQEFKTKLQEEAGLLSELSTIYEQKSAAMDALNQSRSHVASTIRDDFREARCRLDFLEQAAIDGLNDYVNNRLEPLKSDVTRISECVKGSVSRRSSKLLFASSLQFMSNYAAADARLKKTNEMAGILLDEFRSQDLGGTNVAIVDRSPGGIIFNNSMYSFTIIHDRLSNKISVGSGSSGSLGTSEEAPDTPR